MSGNVKLPSMKEKAVHLQHGLLEGVMPSRGSVRKQLHSLISRSHSCEVAIEADPDAENSLRLR